MLAFLYIFIIILLILLVVDKKKIPYYNIYISFLSLALPLICFTFYGQILGFLLSIYLCDSEGKLSLIDSSLKCRTGTWFYIESVLGILCSIFLTFISFVTILIFYRPNFILEENDVLKKTSSIPELILFINKIIFLLIFNFLEDKEYLQWFILFVLFIITFINVYSSFYFNNYENKILMKFNKALSLVLFWSICCLVIGKIFDGWGFNGTFHLFCFGTFLIIIFFIYHKEKINDFYTIEFKQINSAKARLEYIKKLINIIKNKDKSRQNFIIFHTFVLIREENCINKNCKLKKYLNMIEKGNKSDFILHQYCQTLFEMAIKKFPDDIILKSNYIVYLITQMSKKKLAQKILFSMEPKLFHFQNNYIIFCCRKFIEEYTPGSKKNFEEHNKNIMKTMEYEKMYNIFRDDLGKAASLYYEFWSSLYRSHLQGTEDFNKLNNIGEKLNNLIKKIHENFNKLHNVKGDDLKVLNLYSLFLKNILNSKNKYDNLRPAFLDLCNIDKIQDKEVDYSNFDLKVLNNGDEYKYLVVSAEEENLGIILNISLNVCHIFGYNKKEILGKKANILMPEIYHNQFDNYLMQHTNEVKTRFYELLTNKREYFPEFMEMLIDCKNKSKYLIILSMKAFFAQTEKSEHVYIIEFSTDENILLNKLHEMFNLPKINPISIDYKLFNYCYILTDCQFNIQTFTSNCQELLGLNSNALNSNIDITLFIDLFKEFIDKMIYEENMENDVSKYEKSDLNLLNYAENFRNNHNGTYKTNAGPSHISKDKKLIYKRYIAENEFNEYRLINWKIYDLIQLLKGNNNISNISESLRSVKDKKNNNDNNNDNFKIIIQYDKSEKIDNAFTKKNILYGNTTERQFLLVIKKAEFNGKHVGYKFFFKREKVICIPDENVEKKIENNLKFKLNKAGKIKNSVSFLNLNTNENDENNKFNEGNIHNSKTHNFKLLKLSKSLKSKKNEANLDNIDIDNADDIDNNINNLIEGKKSNISAQTEEASVIDVIERKGTSPEKKNILKKKPTKFSSLKNIHKDKISNKNILIIDQNFTPSSDFNFILDIDSMSFRPIHKANQSEKNTLNLLRNEAMAKMKQYEIIKKNLKKNKITFSSHESSYEDSESDEDELSSSLESNHFPEVRKEKKNINLKVIDKEEKSIVKDKKIKEEIEGHYYKVNGLNKIKFMLYDFDQEMVIDKGVKKDIKSEVENNIINYKLKIPIGMDKDINDPSFKIKKYLLKYSSPQLKKEKSTLSSKTLSNIGINKEKKNYKEQESYKRIENALYKNDKEKLIIKMYIFIILSFIIILAIASFILYFIITNLTTTTNNILLLIYSTNLRHFTNMGTYYLTELLVLNMNSTNPFLSNETELTDDINIYGVYCTSYINYPINLSREEYMKNVSDSFKDAFFSGHQNMENMIGMNFELHENNSYHLKVKPFNTIMAYDIFTQRNVTSTLFVSIVQVYSYFYQLIISENINIENSEVFNFMANANNNVGQGIEDAIKIYLSELQIRKKNSIVISVVFIIIIFVFHLFLYFLIKLTYIQIIQRKLGYISIFYDISLNFIKSAMIKCERFISKLNPNELLIIQEKNENYDDSTSFSNYEDDLKLKNTTTKKSNKNNSNKVNDQIDKKIKFEDVSENRVFTIKFVLILLFSFFYLIIILWQYMTLINTIEIIGFYIYYTQHYHNNFLNLFLAFRQFIAYKDSEMHNMKVLEYLSYAEREIYQTFTSDITFLSENSYKITGLTQIFNEIQKNKLCSKDSEIEIRNSMGQ